MRGIRTIWRDRLVAWLATGLLVYLILLQGLVSVYAKSAMAADSFGPAFVICSVDGAVEGDTDHPLNNLARDCCSTLCQVACATGPVVAGTAEAFPYARDLCLAASFPLRSTVVSSADAGLTAEARGPPAVSQ